jgi:hypothetical protein
MYKCSSQEAQLSQPKTMVNPTNAMPQNNIIMIDTGRRYLTMIAAAAPPRCRLPIPLITHRIMNPLRSVFYLSNMSADGD